MGIRIKQQDEQGLSLERPRDAAVLAVLVLLLSIGGLAVAVRYFWASFDSSVTQGEPFNWLTLAGIGLSLLGVPLAGALRSYAAHRIHFLDFNHRMGFLELRKQDRKNSVQIPYNAIARVQFVRSTTPSNRYGPRTGVSSTTETWHHLLLLCRAGCRIWVWRVRKFTLLQHLYEHLATHIHAQPYLGQPWASTVPVPPGFCTQQNAGNGLQLQWQATPGPWLGWLALGLVSLSVIAAGLVPPYNPANASLSLGLLFTGCTVLFVWRQKFRRWQQLTVSSEEGVCLRTFRGQQLLRESSFGPRAFGCGWYDPMIAPQPGKRFRLLHRKAADRWFTLLAERHPSRSQHRSFRRRAGKHYLFPPADDTLRGLQLLFWLEAAVNYQRLEPPELPHSLLAHNRLAGGSKEVPPQPAVG